MIYVHNVKPDQLYSVSWDGVELPDPVRGRRGVAEVLLRGMSQTSETLLLWPNVELRQEEWEVIGEQVRVAWQNFSRLSRERDVLRTAMGVESTLSEPLILQAIDEVRAERDLLLDAQRAAALELEIDGFFADLARRLPEGRVDLDGPARLPEEHLDRFTAVPEEIENLADLVLHYCYCRNHLQHRFNIILHSTPTRTTS